MRVLVTGGTGYLGRAVVRAFATAGHEVVALSRTASRSGVSTLAFAVATVEKPSNARPRAVK